MIDEKDMKSIHDRLIVEFDGRYRQIEDCDDIVDKMENDQHKLELEFAKGNTKLTILIAILSTIAVPLVSVCIKYLFRG